MALSRPLRRVLDRMRLLVRPGATSGRQGGHRSPLRAQGVEFADHRPYVPGDDARHIDWKAFARHGNLVIRQFEEERDAQIHILLDVSGSMGRGKPTKLELARTLAAALVYVGTRQFDRIAVIPFAGGPIELPMAISGPSDLHGLEKVLEETDPAGPTDFQGTVRALASRSLPRGLVWVLSDLMSPEGWAEGFVALGALGHQLKVTRIGCDEDTAPKFQGELELWDAENEERLRLRVHRSLLQAYAKEVSNHHEACQQACRRAGGAYNEVSVHEPIETAVRNVFMPSSSRSSLGGARP